MFILSQRPVPFNALITLQEKNQSFIATFLTFSAHEIKSLINSKNADKLLMEKAFINASDLVNRNNKPLAFSQQVKHALLNMPAVLSALVTAYLSILFGIEETQKHYATSLERKNSQGLWPLCIN